MLLAIPYSRLTYEVDKVQPSQNSSCFALTWGFKTLTWHEPWNTDWFMSGSLYWLIITTPIQLCSIIPYKKQPTKGPLNTCSNEVLHDLTMENSTALLFFSPVKRRILFSKKSRSPAAVEDPAVHVNVFWGLSSSRWYQWYFWYFRNLANQSICGKISHENSQAFVRIPCGLSRRISEPSTVSL